jgi:hypothetical protein
VIWLGPWRVSALISSWPTRSYVPAATDVLPRHRMSRCWDAGLDGRVLLDRICAEGPALLSPEGMMLLVHSAVCDEDITRKRLADAGLQAEVLTRCTVPSVRSFGLGLRKVERPPENPPPWHLVEDRLRGRDDDALQAARADL